MSLLVYDIVVVVRDPLTHYFPSYRARLPTRANDQILNFGMSDNFQKVDFANLPFPAEYLIDYVRVYQRPGIGVMGCDPADHPTAQYIADHANAYSNPNLTTWAQAGYEFPVRPPNL
jgi:hypothetical protein